MDEPELFYGSSPTKQGPGFSSDGVGTWKLNVSIVKEVSYLRNASGCRIDGIGCITVLNNRSGPQASSGAYHAGNGSRARGG
jgi:hypothetical protein